MTEPKTFFKYCSRCGDKFTPSTQGKMCRKCKGKSFALMHLERIKKSIGLIILPENNLLSLSFPPLEKKHSDKLKQIIKKLEEEIKILTEELKVK
jgi:DNA polymerase II large subunit